MRLPARPILIFCGSASGEKLGLSGVAELSLSRTVRALTLPCRRWPCRTVTRTRTPCLAIESWSALRIFSASFGLPLPSGRRSRLRSRRRRRCAGHAHRQHSQRDRLPHSPVPLLSPNPGRGPATSPPRSLRQPDPAAVAGTRSPREEGSTLIRCMSFPIGSSRVRLAVAAAAVAAALPSHALRSRLAADHPSRARQHRRGRAVARSRRHPAQRLDAPEPRAPGSRRPVDDPDHRGRQGGRSGADRLQLRPHISNHPAVLFARRLPAGNLLRRDQRTRIRHPSTTASSRACRPTAAASGASRPERSTAGSRAHPEGRSRRSRACRPSTLPGAST